jgi:nucleoside phosphorylase
MSGPSLLLAAFGPELAGLDRTPPPGWVVATAGVGALAAALGTARLLRAHRPDRVLLVGTCGAYDERLAIGDVFAVARAIAASVEEVGGRAYRPGAEVTRWEATWPVPLPVHDVVVPPAITTSVEGARALARLAPAEHLEATGVLAACAVEGIPVAAVLGVANRVGPSAHAEWEREHRRVSAAVVLAVEGLLRPGGQG